MRVTSKLADVDFKFGRIEREGTTLLIHSDMSQTLQTSVHMSPDDFLDFLKAMLSSRSALFFLLIFPFLLIRYRRRRGESAITPSAEGPRPGDPW